MRIDEREIMFARMSRQPGTKAYTDYYEAHPEHQEGDDRRRQMPHMGEEGTMTHDPINSPMVDAAFHFLGDIKHLAEGPAISSVKVEGSSETFTKRLKGLAVHYGAVLTGVAGYDENYYYSHRGRHDANFGEPVTLKHPYTFVFAVEMAEDMINAAPQLQESLAVTKGYVDAAVIGMVLTYYIKSLGYEARNHMDGNYLMVLPLAAREAGLGDLGRHGLLITESYGPRIRLGAISTNMPLTVDGRSDFNVTAFCELCAKCVRTCPSKSIPAEPSKCFEEGGAPRWQIQQELCYEKWRILGTDCGVCLATCPFSIGLPETLITAYKQNPVAAVPLLEHHNNLHPIRAFNKEKPDWLK